MRIVGHADIRQTLAAALPPVTLLSGPQSVGKWTVAEAARRTHKIFEPDVLRVKRLGVTEARTLASFAVTAPARPEGRVAIVDLDSGSPEAFNVLLKPLEDVRPGMHFLLVSSKPVPYTVSSRAQQMTFGLLGVEEVAQILKEQRGLGDTLAHRLALQSGGQIKNALNALVIQDDRAFALSAVRAIQAGDAEALEGMADRWREPHTDLLVSWCHEIVSQRWRIFSEADVEGMGRSVPLRLLMALRRDVRPRLVVRSILLDVLKERVR